MFAVEANQKKFLASLLLMGVLSAVLFRCVIKPINEHVESEPERRLESARQAREAARDELVKRRDDILLAREKWRSDVLEAGATGPDNTIPPLLTLERNDAGEFMVTNITEEPLCVRMWRTRQQERCELGPRNRCVAVAPGQTLEFTAPGSDGACRGSGLEFRVGNEVTTDLPWWSASAMDDFDRVTGQMRNRELPNFEELRREVEAAEAYLAQEGIAEDWKAVIEPLRQVQLDRMLGGDSAVPEAELKSP